MRCASGPSFRSEVVCRTLRKVKSESRGNPTILVGVDWTAAGRLLRRSATGLISVKPRRRPEEGGPMVW